MSYTNADGLYVLNGIDQAAEQDKGTTVRPPINFLVVNIPDFTAIGSSFGASNIDPNDPVIPANSVIVNADLIISTAADSAADNATLTIGLYTAAGAAIDADGIDATIAQTAIDAQYDVVQCDGALVNGVLTTGAAAGYVGLIYGTAAFTAGAGKLVIQYYTI
jgi:hypothetical protein